MAEDLPVAVADRLQRADDRPLLTDFGIAKRLAANDELTGTGQIMGTLVYAAPEQLGNAKDVGAPADLVICNARNWTELFARPQADRIVLRDGVQIDTTLPDYARLDHLMETA